MWTSSAAAKAAAAEKQRLAVERRAAAKTERQTTVVAMLSSLNIEPPGPKGMIDLNVVSRKLIALHMCNPMVLSEAWSNASPHALSNPAFISTRPDLMQYSLKPNETSPAPPESYRLTPAFWVTLFEMSRIPPPWNTSPSGTLDVKKRAGALSAFTLNNTRYFVRFLLRFEAAFKELDEGALIRRDGLLLFFVATALIGKNGRQVVRESFYVGPRLRKDAALEERFWSFLVANRPPVCDEIKDVASYNRAKEIGLTWAALLHIIDSDMPPYWAAPMMAAAPAPAVAVAQAQARKAAAATANATGVGDDEDEGESTDDEEESVTETKTVTESTTVEQPTAAAAGAAPVVEETTETTTTTTVSADDDEAGEDAPDQPDDETGDSDEEQPAAATAPERAADDEAEFDQKNAPVPPPRDPAAQAGAPEQAASRPQMAAAASQVCMFHARSELASRGNACPSSCVASRIGAALQHQTTAAPRRQAVIGYSLSDSQLVRGGDASHTIAAVLATLSTPVVYTRVMSQLGVSSAVQSAASAGHVRPIASAADWSTVVKENMTTPQLGSAVSSGQLDGIDALAKYAGYANEPTKVRIARYATVYAFDKPLQIRAAWKACGWAMTAQLEKAISEYKRVNPAVPMAEQQVIASLISAGAAR